MTSTLTSRPNRPIELVDRVVLHEGPLSFAELTDRVVTDATRFLVLDLDRTVHLGQNMGELLGWEVCALRAFGQDELARMEQARPTGRMLFDRTRPLASLLYLGVGARIWAAPGLYYLLFGKLPSRIELLRRWTYRRFGPEPVRAVQRVPQNALLRSLSHLPEEILRGLAERVWDRHADEQVIARADLDRLRARHPGLRVVLTSASPRSMVEVAAERLGVDHVEWSEPGRINSGPAKIERLAERLPEVLDPSVETVGITDTGYGEDHCWASHFTRVVDVNSDWPFSPLIPGGSPLREIHSAQLLTRRELDDRLFDGGPRHHRRRTGAPRREARTYQRSELARLLGPALDEANELASDSKRHAARLGSLLATARGLLEGEGPAPAKAPLEVDHRAAAPSGG